MTALVPADNIAAVEALDPEARELAVTRMLSEARSWLAHAVEASEPQSIANFKAQMATIAEATKQLGLSKGIQMDAQEMVRRAERGVGLAIRKGQAEGTVNTRADGTPIRDLNGDRKKVSPSEFMSSGNTAVETYAMTDGVTDDQFDSVLAEAKSEGNLSRAHIVRKIRSKAEAMKLTGPGRLARIQELGAQGWTSEQIAKELGHVESFIRLLARQNGITIPADEAMRRLRRRRRIDHDFLLQQAVTTLEGVVMSLDLLDLNEVDLTDDTWATSLNASIRALNRFNNKIKEVTHVSS